ncbi:cell division protein ZapA [Cupriavidus sp. KK10]|jgi:transposase|uniref:cell division protein ZapA n=1 Tax=Cupriavidus sp. KK10 TaxID=1478019 RepID=UPI0020123E19|nr:cell division protein ZapA [Cupriavidus sp. KK10]
MGFLAASAVDLIIGIDLADQSFQGAGGPTAAARCLRQLANEIEANVSNFADCREGQRIAGTESGSGCVAYLADV